MQLIISASEIESLVVIHTKTGEALMGYRFMQVWLSVSTGRPSMHMFSFLDDRWCKMITDD